jgi:hypothetical protein
MPRHLGDLTRVKGVKDARSRAWVAMHVHRSFTLPQLAMTANIGIDNARHYLLRLQEYGYVRKLQSAANGQPGRFDLWMLVHFTGPLAPIASKDGRLYDPNTQKIHGEPK